MIVVLMGVSGSGKTTIGTVMAARAQAVFADGDDYHTAANRAKMAAGQALTDADRQPWLEALNGLLRRWHDMGTDGILACSALKEDYRTTLIEGMPAGAVQFVWLDGSKAMIAARLAGRQHEFMTGALLESQMQTLEAPEGGCRVVNDRAPAVVVAEILRLLRR